MKDGNKKLDGNQIVDVTKNDPINIVEGKITNENNSASKIEEQVTNNYLNDIFRDYNHLKEQDARIQET